jgi:polysaccharide biosynthesis protein PslG
VRRPLRLPTRRAALWSVVCIAALGAALPTSAPAAKKRTIAGWPYRCTGPAPVTPTGRGDSEDRPGKRRSCRSLTRLAPLDPALSASGYQPAFGLNEDWLYHPDGFSQLPQLGASTSRVNVRWDYVQPVEGASLDWSAYDAIIGGMRAAGVRPMLTVEGAPCWTRRGTPCVRDSHRPPYARHLRDFARFVATTVRRYPEAIGVEVWNEPNLSEYWYPHPQPKLYARMLKLTYHAVKLVNPLLPVVFAGLVPQFGRDPTGQRMDAGRFQRRAYEAGAGRWTDGFGVHPYVFPHGSPILLVGVRAQLAVPKAIAAHFGYPATPLWVTEFGLSSSPDQGLGLDGQATRLGEEYQTLRAVPGIPVVILHRLYDIDPGAAGYQAQMGLIDANGNRKPAFCAIAAARLHPCANLGP